MPELEIAKLVDTSASVIIAGCFVYMVRFVTTRLYQKFDKLEDKLTQILGLLNGQNNKH